MTGVVAIDYVQNETLTSRLTANYNLKQSVGPKSYNIIDTVANGIQASSDCFNVNSLGSHVSLNRTQLTLNFTVPYSGQGQAQSNNAFSIYPIIWCPYSDFLDQDCLNKMLSWYEISGGFSYKSNDQVYRNCDTREIITHSYNKTQCEKYGLFRSPYCCTSNLTTVGTTPIRTFDWNLLNPGINSANALQRYSIENQNNWIYQQNLRTNQIITVSNLVGTASGGSPPLSASTDAYGNIIAVATSTGVGYTSTFTCNINIQITMNITDKLLDSIMRSEHGQSIRVDNRQLTYTFYYNQYYTNYWLIKSARTFASGATGFGMCVKSNTVSSSLRVYGFTTTLPDNGLFTKPYYDWANQRILLFALFNGSIPFKIEIPQLNVLPSQCLLYSSGQLWNGANAQLVQALIASGLEQFNLGHNIFGRMSGLVVQIDNEIVNQTLDDDYFRRETARQNMDNEGGFDDTVYRKIMANYSEPLYNTEEITNVVGGVPYVIIDFAKLCLDNNVALIRNDRPKNITVSGTISLDQTTLAGITNTAVLTALNAMQMTVYLYELKPAVIRMDPSTNTLTNDYITANTTQMSSLDVQNQMAQITEQIGVPEVDFSERLSGGNIGSGFFDSLKKFALPILKPVFSYGIKKIADNFRSNGEWNAQNRWMPKVAPVIDAVGDWVGSGIKRRPMLR